VALIVGHRGCAQPYPSNTLAAFGHALELGADVVEADVRRTRDGVLVVAHDEHLEDGRRVHDLHAGDMDHAVGERVARLDEVVDAVAGRAVLQLDLKQAGIEEDVVVAVRRAGAIEWTVMTGNDHAVRRMKRAEARIRCGLSLGREARPPAIRLRVSELWPGARIRASGADFVSAHWRLARAGVIRRCSAAGVPVWVWTVNDRGLLRRFLADARVDAVITDLPQAALAVRDGLALDRAGGG